MISVEVVRFLAVVGVGALVVIPAFVVYWMLFPRKKPEVVLADAFLNLTRNGSDVHHCHWSFRYCRICYQPPHEVAKVMMDVVREELGSDLWARRKRMDLIYEICEIIDAGVSDSVGHTNCDIGECLYCDGEARAIAVDLYRRIEERVRGVQS